MIKLENEFFKAKLHPTGAALRDFIFKPVGHSIILSPQTPAFEEKQNYLGAVVGPIANRIAGAQFELDGKIFSLDPNEGSNTLHGGTQGLSELEWKIVVQSQTAVTFEINLPDLHMGFPGPSRFTTTYRLIENMLEVEFQATSPRANYFNLAPHIYFNLMGEGDISSHSLQISADHYLPVDNEKIPTGEIKNVTGTAYDYRIARSPDFGDLDHNFCLNEDAGIALRLTAPNGVELSVSTNQSGVQIYNGQHLGSTGWAHQNGKPITNFGGLAIEPQAWPNAVNEANFQMVTAYHKQISQFTFHKLD